MTLLERLRNYVKEKFSAQNFEDYKTLEGQIVTGELEVGKELLDLESMTALDGEMIIDGKKIIVEKGVIKSIEPIEVDEEMEEVTVDEEAEEDTTQEEAQEVEEEMIEDVIVDKNLEIIENLKAEIEALKKEINDITSEKETMGKKLEKMSAEPVKEVIIEPVKPIKKNKSDDLAQRLKSISKTLYND